MTALSPPAASLVRLMSELPRGPRRDGAFALWLTLRAIEDLTLVPPLPDRPVRRRFAALEARLATLAVPTSLRRALAAAATQLTGAAPPAPGLVLQQLVAPARDTLGRAAAEAIAAAARRATPGFEAPRSRTGLPDRG